MFDLIQMVALSVSWLILMLFPGFLIASLFSLSFGRPFYEEITLWSTTSFAMILLLGIMREITKWSLQSTLMCLLVSMVLTGAVLMRLQRKISLTYPKDRFSRTIFILMGGLTLWLAIAAPYFGMDTWQWLASIQQVKRVGSLFPPSFQFGTWPPDMRSTVFHYAIALLSTLSHVEVITSWKWVQVFLLPLEMCAVWTFAAEVFGKDTSKHLALILLWIFAYGSDNVYFQVLGSSYFAGEICKWLAFTYFLRWMKGDRSSKNLSLIGLTIFVVSGFHGFYPLLFLTGFSISIFFLLRMASNMKETLRSSAILLGILLIAILPMSWLRYYYSQGIFNPYHLFPGVPNTPPIVNTWMLNSRLFLLAPQMEFVLLGLTTAGLLLMTPPMEKFASIFLWANITAAPFIMYNPVLIPLLNHFSIPPNVAAYFDRLWAVLFVVWAHSIVTLFDQRPYFKLSVKRALIISLLLVLFIPQTIPILSRIKQNVKFLFYQETRAGLGFHDVETGMKALDSLSPHREIVLGDRITSIAIPALTRHYVVAVEVYQASSQAPDMIERIEAERELFGPGPKNLTKINHYLNRFNVRYIFVNKKLAGKETLGWLKDQEKPFHLAYQDASTAIFQVL